MNRLQLNNLIIPSKVNNFKLLKWNLFALKFLGIFVTSDQGWPITRLICGRILIFIFIFGHIVQISSLFVGEWTGVQRRVITIACMMIMFNCACQLIHFVFNQQKFSNIIMSVSNNVNKYVTSAEGTEKETYLNYFKFFEDITKSVLSLAVIAYILTNLDIAYQVWAGNLETDVNIFKLKAAPLCYKIYPFANFSSNIFIGYIFPPLLLFPASLFLATWRTFFVCLLTIGVFQLKAFNMKVEKALKFTKWDKNNTTDTVDIKNCGTENYLNHCVMEHIEIKLFLQELQSLISGHSFLDIFVCSSFFCFVIYHLLAFRTFDAPSIVLIFASGFLLLIVLLYNGLADEITQNDNHITTAIYVSEINWYEQPMHIKKIILTMMKATHHPFKLKAFSIEMKYETFLSILKGTFSYLTLLQHLDAS